MKLDAKTVEHIVLIGAHGAAAFIPALALPVAALDALAKELEAAGVIPVEVPAHLAEQLASVGAGAAASRASAITSDRERRRRDNVLPPTFVSGFSVVAGPSGSLPADVKTGGGPESVQAFVPPATTPTPAEAAALAASKGSP